MYAFNDKILVVNLDNKTFETLKPPLEYYKKYIGGSGLDARLFIDYGGLEASPLSKNNPLIFMVGPLTGLTYPLAGRHFACARSPLTTFWGQGSSGGYWGAKLKKAGYDGLILLGGSDKPVYIVISNNDIEIRDAQGVWGLDSFKAEEEIKKDIGDKKFSVATIGQAGENRVLFAAIQNDRGRVVGRTGLGAVMGVKKVKGIAVYGDREVSVYNKDMFEKRYYESIKKVRKAPATKILRTHGTNALFEQIYEYGDLPLKYWSLGIWDIEKIRKLSGPSMTQAILRGVKACYLCPIACGREFEIKEGPYKGVSGHGPEYETVAAFGPLMLIDDINFIAYAGDLCNRYGIDTISTGSVIAFAMELYEKNIIDKNETDGIEIRWGDKEVVIELIRMITFREGFGNYLADGVRRLAERYGEQAKKLAVHVKGLEFPMHDPRAFESWTLAYATSNRGACHTYASTYYIEKGLTFPEIGYDKPLDRFDYKSKPLAVKKLQDIYEFLDSMVMCRFHLYGGLPIKDVLDTFNLATGWNLTVDDALLIGERIFNLKRWINNKFGVDIEEDRLPEKIFIPLSEGGTKGHIPHWNEQIYEYYRLRGWNERGIVKKETLERLDIP